MSLDLNQARAHEGQQAPPLQTFSTGAAPGAMSASGAATSQLQLQPQPSIGVPLSDAQHAPALALLTLSNGVAPSMRAPKRKRGRPRKNDPLDLNLDAQQAHPLQTFSNGVAPAMSASGAATSQLQLQPQPSVGAPLSYQHAPALLNFSNGLEYHLKRKRGRPRKNDVPSVAMPAPLPAGIPWGVGLVIPEAPPALPLPLLSAPPSVNATQRVKKRRKVTAAGLGVIGLDPEVITIQVGENISTKVMSFSGNGWALCILSAHGVVSNMTLRHGTCSDETTIYEGYFDILFLSGSYQPSETNGMSSHTGGLSVSLAGLDGRVFGGGVAGALTAASLVQVVIGRFRVRDKEAQTRCDQ